MKFTANTKIASLAKEILAKYQQIAADAEAELAKLDDESNELRDDVIKTRTEALYDAVKGRYADARAGFAKQLDSAIQEIRQLAETIKPQKPDAAAAQILSVLSIAPTVSQAMLESAAESVGTNQFGQDTLRQIARQHNLILPQLPPAERHLRSADLAAIADDLADSFKWYFDAHTNFLPERAAGGTQYGSEGRENTVVRARRGSSTRSLQNIADGNAFDFGGDNGLQTEFNAAAESADI